MLGKSRRPRNATSNTTTASGTNRSIPTTIQSRAVSSPQTRAPLTQPGIPTRTSRYGQAGGSIPQRSGNLAPQPTVQESRPSPVARSIPRRQPSQQWISASSMQLSAAASPEAEESYTPAETPTKLEHDAVTKALRSTSFESRPTLAERTIETLSRLPSSPSVRGKVGAPSFFDPPSNRKNPPSRPSSRLSRPGSSHQSDGSSQGLVGADG